MNRIFLIFGLLVFGASLVSATCVSISEFSPTLDASRIDLPQILLEATAGSPIPLDMGPQPTVDDFTVTSIRGTSTVDVSVSIITEKRPDDTYLLTPTFRFGPGLSLDDLDDARFTFEADVEFTRTDGSRGRETICLGNIDVSVRGAIADVEDLVDSLIDRLESIETIFDVIDLLLTVARIGMEYECAQAQAQHTMLETIWDENCAPWDTALIAHVIAGEPDISVACGAGGTQCIANLTGAGGGANCPVLYASLLDSERNVSNACARNECEPVRSLDAHTLTYEDPLGITRCDGTDLSDPACRAEFERVQTPFCPSANVTELNEAASADTLTLSLSNICSTAEPRVETEYIKNPAGDLVSSMQCMCLPALQGYVKQVERMYTFASECLFSSADNSSRDCKESTYSFVCEMVIGSALRCAGLGYEEFSGSTRTFRLPDGTTLDFSDPAAVSSAIENGGIFVFDGGIDLSIDTTNLAHAVCESALGNETFDWSSVLDPRVAGSGGFTGRLCAPDVELHESCVCDLTETGPARMCGTSAVMNHCSYDTATRTSSCTTFDPMSTALADYEAELERASQRVVRAMSERDAGVYGPTHGIVSCVDRGSYVVVGMERSGSTEYAPLRTGHIVLHETPGLPGAVALREYSCPSANQVRIAITPTGITP